MKLPLLKACLPDVDNDVGRRRLVTRKVPRGGEIMVRCIIIFANRIIYDRYNNLEILEENNTRTYSSS